MSLPCSLLFRELDEALGADALLREIPLRRDADSSGSLFLINVGLFVNFLGQVLVGVDVDNLSEGFFLGEDMRDVE